MISTAGETPLEGNLMCPGAFGYRYTNTYGGESGWETEDYHQSYLSLWWGDRVKDWGLWANWALSLSTTHFLGQEEAGLRLMGMLAKVLHLPMASLSE